MFPTNNLVPICVLNVSVDEPLRRVLLVGRRHYASCSGFEKYPHNFPVSSLCMYGCWTEHAPEPGRQQTISQTRFRGFIPTRSVKVPFLLALQASRPSNSPWHGSCSKNIECPGVCSLSMMFQIF